jgi:hypothetical protein
VRERCISGAVYVGEPSRFARLGSVQSGDASPTLRLNLRSPSGQGRSQRAEIRPYSLPREVKVIYNIAE